MPIKVAVLGAGSVGFTRSLTRDILTVPELQDTHFAYHDIDERNLSMVYQLVKRDIESSKLPATVTSHLDRREAIADADYVLCFVRVGGLDAFTCDVDIPLKYGVDQCVGDTLGPGGIMYAQRGIPVLLDFCKDIREVAKPNCLLLNYSNPMAMLTWACIEYGKVRTVGLCHGVIHGHEQIAEAFGLKANEVDIICAGINHQTWYIEAKHGNRNLLPELLEKFEAHDHISKTEKVRIDMLKRFGYYSTESNGHLSEYVPWYRKRPDEIARWIDTSSWIHGETGGYLRVCKEGRNWFDHDFDNWMKAPPITFNKEDRGKEHGSYIIESLETGRMYRGHFNVRNQGIISNLPGDAIIEAPGYVDNNGISMPLVGDLPLGCAAVCNASISVQRLAVKAAIEGNLTYLKQAMLLDPLTGAVCNPEEVWQMADEMIVAEQQWLPQFKSEIEGASERLKVSSKENSRNNYRGAVRFEVRDIDALAKDHAMQQTVAETDKAKATK